MSAVLDGLSRLGICCVFLSCVAIYVRTTARERTRDQASVLLCALPHGSRLHGFFCRTLATRVFSAQVWCKVKGTRSVASFR